MILELLSEQRNRLPNMSFISSCNNVHRERQGRRVMILKADLFPRKLLSPSPSNLKLVHPARLLLNCLLLLL